MAQISDDDVWSRVRRFALAALESGKVIPTVTKRFGNRIVSVTDGRILRRSEKGRTESWVNRAHVIEAWHRLRDGGERGEAPFFADALLVAALPQYVGVKNRKAVLISKG